MAVVNVTSFYPNVQGGTLIISSVPSTKSQTITSSGSSTQSEAFISTFVRVAVTGGDVHVSIGENPTVATTNGILILSNSVEYFAVSVGHKLAVINA